MPQEHVTMSCTVCRHRNYHTTKNPKNVRNKLELKKYCKWCRKHTPHKEV
jgi:large subunit ribosomal protein L33